LVADADGALARAVGGQFGEAPLFTFMTARMFRRVSATGLLDQRPTRLCMRRAVACDHSPLVRRGVPFVLAAARASEPAGGPEGNSMSDFGRNYEARSASLGRGVAVDAGLRAYMLRVYNYMAVGVALSGVAALVMFQLTVTEVGGRLGW